MENRQLSIHRSVEAWEFDVNNFIPFLCQQNQRCKVVLLLTASKMDAKELAKAMNCRFRGVKGASFVP